MERAFTEQDEPGEALLLDWAHPAFGEGIQIRAAGRKLERVNALGRLKPKKRRRFRFHFTPTSSSWLNQVERFFALLTGRMVPRGAFRTDELEQAIYKWLAHWNGAPAPFVWKAAADVILDGVRRCKELTRTGD